MMTMPAIPCMLSQELLAGFARGSATVCQGQEINWSVFCSISQCRSYILVYSATPQEPADHSSSAEKACFAYACSSCCGQPADYAEANACHSLWSHCSCQLLRSCGASAGGDVVVGCNGLLWVGGPSRMHGNVLQNCALGQCRHGHDCGLLWGVCPHNATKMHANVWHNLTLKQCRYVHGGRRLWVGVST